MRGTAREHREWTVRSVVLAAAWVAATVVAAVVAAGGWAFATFPLGDAEYGPAAYLTSATYAFGSACLLAGGPLGIWLFHRQVRWVIAAGGVAVPGVALGVSDVLRAAGLPHF